MKVRVTESQRRNKNDQKIDRDRDKIQSTVRETHVQAETRVPQREQISPHILGIRQDQRGETSQPVT